MAKDDSGLKVKKKKKWCQIVAPKSMNDMLLGETRVFNPSDMMGKTIKQNLMNLTGDMKKQNVTMSFKVTDVQGDTAVAQPISYEIVPTSIKRLVRRGRDRLDDSFLAITKDDKVVRVKTLLLTKTNTVESKLRALRKESRFFLKPFIRRQEYEPILFDLVDYKFQNTMKGSLKRIFPLKNCEIRVFKLEKVRDEDFEKMKLYQAPPEPVPKQKKEVKPEPIVSQADEVEAEIRAEEAEGETQADEDKPEEPQAS
jgi:ribosomal protein S3AE